MIDADSIPEPRVIDVYDETLPDDQLVERLHAMLAQVLMGNRPQAFDSPVTVAEIYQDLVPYRNVRSALGFQMNADYEHTLLRMLAGEGGLARLEPAEARDELQTELDTPNPNVGLFRKFAACDVWVTPGEAVDFAEAERTPDVPIPQDTAGKGPAAGIWGSADTDPGSVETDLDEWESALPELILEDVVPAEATTDESTSTEPAPESPPVETTHQPEATTMIEAAASPAAGAVAHSADCAFCAASLPAGRTVKFCPYCGMDQAFQPCSTCAEPLEPAWRFCITCGASQDAGTTG